MTKEEYIDFANALKNNYTIDFDKLPEFCDMAISALSENKGDLISRQAVLDELKKLDWQDLYLPSHFKQILDDVPPADVRPNIHGHWLEHGAYDECSVCLAKKDNLIRGEFNFCPTCGADMREPKGEKGTE